MSKGFDFEDFVGGIIVLLIGSGILIASLFGIAKGGAGIFFGIVGLIISGVIIRFGYYIYTAK